MGNLSEKIVRLYTKELEDHPEKTVYDLFNWEKRNVYLTDYQTGNILCDMKDLEFPDFYTAQSCDIIASKYFRKKGIPKTEHEVSLKQVVHRMVEFWVSALIEEDVIEKDSKEAQILYDELAFCLIDQRFAPNSPQWFNTGLYRTYGIKGSPQHMFFYDPKEKQAKELPDAYSRSQSSACFILSVEDALLGKNSITDHYVTETRLFKGGSGVGTNFSPVRAKGESLSGGGTSSGVMSFLEGLDRNAGAIKSGGTCLAPWARVYVVGRGPCDVQVLADEGKPFYTLTYHPGKERITVCKATAFKTGYKPLMEIVTNHGSFTVTIDHPVLLENKTYVQAKDLRKGEHILAGSVFSFKEEKWIYLHNKEKSYASIEDLVHVDTEGQKELENLKEAPPLEENIKELPRPFSVVTKIRFIEPGSVYNVEVENSTPRDHSKKDGHNFLIISEKKGKEPYLEGIYVSNTRRSARMVMLDVDHPEIEDFISWKDKEEDKVRALAKMGYDAGMDGEAYHTVSGQNSNNSVRFSDEFMKKVENLSKDPDATITLKGRVDHSVDKEVKVKDLWELFNRSAYHCADPAPLFDDTFNAWHTCPYGENGKSEDKHNRINATNPCGEYAFLDNSACNLASINILKFYNMDTGEFDVKAYLHTIFICQLLLEASIVWGAFPTEEIAERTYHFRTTGLGITNLAALLMAMGLPYDSEEGRAVASGLVGLLTGESYVTSALLAEGIGPFTYYEKNKKAMLRVIRNHARVAGALSTPFEDLSYKPIKVKHKLLKSLGLSSLSEELISSWENALTLGESFGYRNAQVSVMAPTGCLTGDTFVSTDRGFFKLSELGNPIGDKWQKTKGRIASLGKPEMMSKFYINGRESTRKVTTEHGFSLQGTLRHQVKVWENGNISWKVLSDIKEGDLLPVRVVSSFGKTSFYDPFLTSSLPPLYKNDVPKMMTPELSLFIGTFMGVGEILSQKVHPVLQWRLKDKEKALKILNLAKSLFKIPLISEIEEESKMSLISEIKEIKGDILLQISDEADILYRFMMGDRKDFKAEVPYILRKTNSRCCAMAFASGLFFVSGKETPEEAVLTLSNEAFSKEVQSLLLSIGFPFGREEKEKTYILKNLYEKDSDLSFSFDTFAKFPLYNLFPDKKAVPLRKINGQDPIQIDEEYYFLEKVKENVDGGEEYTYDLSVPKNVTYLANGFISHNTISFAMGAASTSIEPFFGHVTYKKLSGGGYMKLANPMIEAGLKSLGYSEKERQAIIDYVMREKDGTISDGKIEGAPYLKEEDYPVFDTANKCGTGVRAIAPMGHVEMVAALAPLVSGSISKTVNLPHDATIDDFKSVTLMSWKKGIKGITLYRDGSKFTQPLNQQLEGQVSENQELEDLNYYALLEEAKTLKDFKTGVLKGEIVQRNKAEGVRSGRTHPAQIEDIKLYTTVNRNSEGKITEIYVTTDREGTLVMGLLNSLSKTISVMLQYHIPPEQISKMLRGQKYEPYGFVTRHPYIKYVSSISDLISKIIDLEIGDYSHLQIKPEKDFVLPNAPSLLSLSEEKTPSPLVSLSSKEEPEKEEGNSSHLGERVYGKTCSICGSDDLRSNGTCFVCARCGSTTGCS